MVPCSMDRNPETRCDFRVGQALIQEKGNLALGPRQAIAGSNLLATIAWFEVVKAYKVRAHCVRRRVNIKVTKLSGQEAGSVV